jgi:hypothetical protein
VNGGKITAKVNAAVSTNGSDANSEYTSGDTSLKITGGTLTGGDVGVYVPAGTFEITGGSISGSTGVAAKGGTLEISGGTITGTGLKNDFVHNGDGWSTTGDGLAIESCGYPYGPADVSITGGEFKSTNANAVAFYVYQNNRDVTDFIKGGTFSTDPSTYVPDGYVAVSEDGAYAVQALTATNGVAAIGDKGYKTLAAAIADAANGEIKLLKDVTLTATQDITANVTIDLNGHKITGDAKRVFQVKSGTLTLTGEGTLKSTGVSSGSSVIRVGDGGDTTKKTGSTAAGLELGKDVTIEAPDSYGVSVFGSDTTETVVIDGTIHAGLAGALSGNGIASYDGTTITINATAELTSEKAAAIYHPQAGTLTIKGGTIKGASGIEVKAGDTSVTVDGNPTITATGEVKHSENNNGNSSSGYSIALVENKNYAAGATVTINSGSYTGPVAILQDNAVTEDQKGTLTIKGGIFSDDPSIYCATGLSGVANTDSSTKSAYPYAVGELSTEEVEDAPAVGETDVKAAANVFEDEETKAAVEAALADVAADEASLTDAVDDVEVTDAEKDDAIKALVAAGIIDALDDGQVPEGTTVTIVKEAYLEVEVTGYDAENGTITVNITPKYNLIATTGDPDKEDDVNAENSVTIAEAQTLTVTGTVQLTIPLPENFVGEAETAYVIHEHNGKYYIYTGTVTDSETANVKDVTFENPNGFSLFEVTLENPIKASITSASGSTVGYLSLREAVAAVKNGETITISGDNTEKITVSRAVNFAIKGGTANISAGTGYSCTTGLAIGGKQYNVWAVPTAVGSVNYAIDISDSQGGKVTASAVKAQEGAKVVLTPAAEDGKELDTLTVTDATGAKLTVTKGTDGTYSFTMPAGAVTVKATFKTAEKTTCPSEAFTDVDTSKWYHEYVDYALTNGIMEGNGDGTFTPNKEVTRAQLAQILYNLAKKPAVTGKSTFTDVADGVWYTDAIVWAAQQGIVDGYEDGTFHPNDYIKRQDLAVMLWRYAGKPTATQTTLNFTDADQVSGYAKAAVLWANEQGIMEGNGNSTLNPKGYATRAQAAKMFTVYLQSK